MRNLIPADVYPLYQQRFWDVIGGDICPRGLDYALMDLGWSARVGRVKSEAAKMAG